MTAEPAPSFACQRNWPETAAPRIWTPSGFDRWCGVAGQGAHPIWRIPGVRHPATWPRRAIRAGRNRPGVSLPRRRVGFLPAPQDRRFSACPPYRARGCTARPKAKPSAGGRRVEDDRAPRWRRNPSRSQQSGCRSQSRVESADALMPDVTLRSPATPARQRFLVRAMANVALHLRWAGRGLAAWVVYDAHDLAHAAAAAGIHWGTPVSDDRLRLRTAALAEHFSDGRHKRPASGSHVPPSGDRQPGAEGTAENHTGSRDKPDANLTPVVRPSNSRYLERAAVVQSRGLALLAGYLGKGQRGKEPRDVHTGRVRDPRALIATAERPEVRHRLPCLTPLPIRTVSISRPPSHCAWKCWRFAAVP
jgi:hypothetical protein